MELRVVEVKCLMLSEARPAADTLQACGNAASLTSEPHVSVSRIKAFGLWYCMYLWHPSYTVPLAPWNPLCFPAEEKGCGRSDVNA